MDTETTQNPLRAQPFSMLLPGPADLERIWAAHRVIGPIGPSLAWGEHEKSPFTVAEAVSPERGYVFSAFGRHWVEYHPAPTSEKPEPQADQSLSPTTRSAPSRSRLSVVWRTHFMPIIIAGLGGLMIGVLFLLVAAAAVLVESWAYAITFGFVGVSLVFVPVSLIFTHLCRSTPDPAAARAASDEQT